MCWIVTLFGLCSGEQLVFSRSEMLQYHRYKGLGHS